MQILESLQEVCQHIGHELHYATYDGNAYMVFCSQYGQTSPNGWIYEYDTQFKAELNSGAYQRIAEYIYFGYTMKHGAGLPNSAQARKDACATQQYVWEYIRNNINFQYGAPSRDSWKNGYMSSSIYSSWLSETERIYNNYHNTNVSFNGQTQKTVIGESKTFTDVNGVLASYQSFNQTTNGITFNHIQGSNDLIVTVDGNTNANSASFSSNGYGIYRLMPNGTQYSAHEMSSYIYFHFTSGAVQDLIFSSYVDPTFFNFNIEVESGKILLKKVNNIGNAVSECKFELYTDENCTNKVNTGITDKNGNILFDKLKPGIYYIKETEVAHGYLIDENIKQVIVKAGETASVEFKNNEPTGEIYIYKVNDNGDAVGNAEFIVKAKDKITNVAKTKTYFNKGDTVATIVSDEKTGIATIKELPMGKYTVQEIKAPTGYLLNNKIYDAELKFINNKTPIVELKIEGVINDEPTGTITIIKRDSEKGNVAQGDATLENAKYEVYANEDIWNKAHTIKHYSKGDLVSTRTTNDRGNTTDVTGLPLGKYLVKESVSSLGYLLDTKEYEANLEYKDQKTEVISKVITSNEAVKKMQVHIYKSGIKENSGLVPGLQGAEFTMKLYSDVEKALDSGYSYAEIWNGLDEYGNSVKVDSKRVAEAQKIAPSYESIVTDENGDAYTQNKLPYGKYLVKETKTPKDFYVSSDFTFSITEDESEVVEIAKKIKHLYVNNEQMETYIKLVKKDADSGKIVSLNSATFQIKAAKDIYDRGNGKIIYKKGEIITQKVGSTVYNSFTTNSKNLVVVDGSYDNIRDEQGTVVTPLLLPVGEYEVSEIKIPSGYLQLDSPIKFKVDTIKDYDQDNTGDYIKTVEIKNNKPFGTLIVDKSVALKENVDTSIVDVSDLSGIQFKLSAKVDIIDPADGSIIYKKGQEVNTYNVDKKGNLKIEKLPMGTYELQEVKTLDGLVLNETKYEVKFTQKDTTTKVYTETREIVNDTTLVEISKTTITGDKELPGAELSVIDENGKVIDKWTSSNKAHTIEGLTVGKEYTLREDLAPLGYVKATEIKFKVENTNETQKVVMIDKIVEMTKNDIGGEEIEGAELKVFDKEGNIVDEWTSTNEAHKIKNLVEGKTYTLHEEYAPEGYVIATDVEFTVSKDKETQKIEMIDKIVEMSKKDIAGDELEGATIIVTNTKTKNIVDKWVSGKEPHRIQGLIEGETYVMHEEIAIDGYVKATDIEFTVSKDKETQKIEMIDKVVLVSKTELVTGEELPGAELEVTDKEGNVIDKWTSTNEPHHVTGLEEGKEYTLTEKTCPYGYEVAESINFVVTTDKETQLVEMKDMPIQKTIKVIKADSETKETIKAKFKFGIYEDPECTKLIKEVKADKESGTVTFEDLRYGTYYIKETKAPFGYQLSDKVVKIEINNEGTFADGELLEDNDSICTFTYYNKLIPKIQTGSEMNYILLIGSAIISLLGITTGIVVLKRKNKNN